jgi:hypothetical protein
MLIKFKLDSAKFTVIIARLFRSKKILSYTLKHFSGISQNMD